MECQCCFDDFTPPKVTHCNGEDTHFFCLDCARQNAFTDIGNSRYELRCMDGSGCKATFSRSERSRFLDEKTTEKLERLQQQEEIRMAELQNLSMCPFCDFAAICPPIEEDREFRCHNPQCEEVSCRLCKSKTHVPLSCEEFKKENGVSERRVIEEARTEALIRTCGKCKVRILKEDGCNKVICSSCSAVICDYCGKDISKQMYNHFDGQGRAPPGVATNGPGAKCPLYDESDKRKDNQVDQAEKEAMGKVRAEHPDLSEEDLKIRFAKSVQSPTKRHNHHHHLGRRHGYAHYDIDDFELPPFGGFGQDRLRAPGAYDPIRRQVPGEPPLGPPPAPARALPDAEQQRERDPEEVYQHQLAQQQRFRQLQHEHLMQQQRGVNELQRVAERNRQLQEQRDRLRQLERERDHLREARDQARLARERARIAGEQAQAAVAAAAAYRRDASSQNNDVFAPNGVFGQHGPSAQGGPFDPNGIFGANANRPWENDNPFRGNAMFDRPTNNPNQSLAVQPQLPIFPPLGLPDFPRALNPPRPDFRAAAERLNERRRRQMAAVTGELDPISPPRLHNNYRPALDNNNEANVNPWLNGPRLNEQPPKENQGWW